MAKFHWPADSLIGRPISCDRVAPPQPVNGLLTLGICFLVSANLLSADPPAQIIDELELNRRIAKAENDPHQLLILSHFANPKTRKDLRKKVHLSVKNFTQISNQAELRQLTEKMAKLLVKLNCAETEIEEILGKEYTVHRQIFFRSFRIEWRYSRPLPLVVEWEYNRGQSGNLISAYVWRPS